MTKEQAVLELRQALSKVDRDLRLFGATEGQQAADRTWGALEYDMAAGLPFFGGHKPHPPFFDDAPRRIYDTRLHDVLV